MMSAIITGSTGLIGRSLANHLAGKNIKVFCVGRKNLSQEEVEKIFLPGVTYRQLLMRNVERLGECISQEDWHPGENCVFYHFAWGGISSLTDGTFENQLDNAIWSANGIKAAKIVGCKKFVNAGTLEETFIARFLQSNAPNDLKITQSNYGLAKIASRDMCKIIAYLEKIDYVHTRLSAPLDPNLDSGGYIAATLKKIRNGLGYEAPNNPKPFDFISVQDAAIAYELIGRLGKNKSDYFVGSGQPATLGEFFSEFQKCKNPDKQEKTLKVNANYASVFDIKTIIADTGFSPRPFLEVETAALYG